MSEDENVKNLRARCVFDSLSKLTCCWARIFYAKSKSIRVIFSLRESHFNWHLLSKKCISRAIIYIHELLNMVLNLCNLYCGLIWIVWNEMIGIPRVGILIFVMCEMYWCQTWSETILILLILNSHRERYLVVRVEGSYSLLIR